MAYDFTVVSNQLIVTLDTESGAYEPQIFTLKIPSIELGVTLHLKEAGHFVKHFQFNDFGLIDGVAPTDLLDAYDLLSALIAPLVPTLNLGIQSVSGDSVDNADPDNPIVNAIPITGTEVGSPVTGNIEIQGAGADLIIFSKGDSDIIENQISFGDGSLEFGVKNNSSSYHTKIIIGDESIMINNAPGSSGLSSMLDFTPNITDLDYTQKKYVDNQVGKFISKTTVEINEVVLPQAGQTFYNSTLGTLCFYNGTIWKQVTSSNM